MSAVQDEFKARIERDVARIMRHIMGSEMDARELDGVVTLRIENGALAGVEFADARMAEIHDTIVQNITADIQAATPKKRTTRK